MKLQKWFVALVCSSRKSSSSWFLSPSFEEESVPFLVSALSFEEESVSSRFSVPCFD